MKVVLTPPAKPLAPKQGRENTRPRAGGVARCENTCPSPVLSVGRHSSPRDQRPVPLARPNCAQLGETGNQSSILAVASRWGKEHVHGANPPGLQRANSRRESSSLTRSLPLAFPDLRNSTFSSSCSALEKIPFFLKSFHCV